ncbi:putative serine protease K12H4.7 isoform X1 [Haliotis asinina]|uniref:putative serine protease K12H4.7 isoform X1 n=1 Tax=Haliotis asinina TaxID=109174 RepID=UPI003531CA6F
MEHNNFIFVVWSIIFLSTYKVDVLGSPDTTGPPGGAPSPPPTMSSEYWFHQKLDHFNVEDSRYWKQRYYVFDEFYKPGGPAFLTIGGEGALGVYVQEGAWMDYIQTYHAIGFAVEHRYYGESRPTPDLSTANLEYLTIEQVLEDVASFIVGATKEHNLADTKWVTFGGSYAGMLSAYVRYKFPHLVAGAIASSAPVAVSVFAPEFIVSIGESLRFVPGCYQAVADAFNDARQHLKDDTGAQHLQSLFRLCAFDYTNQLDAETMLNGLMSPIINTAQYSNDNMGYMTGRQLSVSSMCRVMTDTSRGTALVRLADYHAIVYNNYTNVRAPCDNVTFTFLVNNAKNVTYKGGDIALGRQWMYQMCTQLGAFITSTAVNQPFGNVVSEDYVVRVCQAYFGPTFNATLLARGVQQMWMDYGRLGIQATNVVYTHGSYDPWHKYGLSTDPNPQSPVIIIQGVGHVADLFKSSQKDNIHLKQARNLIRRLIGQWIQSHNDPIVG